ncbi:MAG: SpoIIE family protein phosphatase [Sulfuritalea sp.]|nr:SpoIIE family protein phosphatase [Sulfuritalea sp.]
MSWSGCWPIPELPDGRDLQYRVVPSAVFSGDMVLARRTPAGRLHLLLADAVGHGLPAAINILPLFFPFDGMSRKGCTLATVARELNRRVRDLLPIDRFVAATLVSVDTASGVFEIWNGGNPRHCCSTPRAGEPAHRFHADGAGAQRRQSGAVRDATGGLRSRRPTAAVFRWHLGESGLLRRRPGPGHRSAAHRHRTPGRAWRP